jgi:anion-transporting  ArsA/GET3 family ATPase
LLSKKIYGGKDMSFFKKYFFGFFGLFLETTVMAQPEFVSQDEAKKWIQEAIHYGFNMQTVDYTKYMSDQYVEHIDGKVFDFQQWLHHMTGIKDQMKSYKIEFDDVVYNENKIAASYRLFADQKKGGELEVKIMAIFTIKDKKMIFCDELTHLLKGPVSKQHLSDQD